MPMTWPVQVIFIVKHWLVFFAYIQVLKIQFVYAPTVALHAPTAIFQEVVRATLATWYRDLVSVVPTIKDGIVLAPTAPGLGTALNPDVRRRDDATVRESGKPA